jgi:hypothetical protein
MVAAVFLMIGVLLCFICGPAVLALTLRTEFRLTDFLTEEATLDAGIGLVIGVACIAAGYQIFARAK